MENFILIKLLLFGVYLVVDSKFDYNLPRKFRRGYKDASLDVGKRAAGMIWNFNCCLFAFWIYRKLLSEVRKYKTINVLVPLLNSRLSSAFLNSIAFLQNEILGELFSLHYIFISNLHASMFMHHAPLINIGVPPNMKTHEFQPLYNHDIERVCFCSIIIRLFHFLVLISMSWSFLTRISLQPRYAPSICKIWYAPSILNYFSVLWNLIDSMFLQNILITVYFKISINRPW